MTFKCEQRSCSFEALMENLFPFRVVTGLGAMSVPSLPLWLQYLFPSIPISNTLLIFIDRVFRAGPNIQKPNYQFKILDYHIYSLLLWL